MITDLPQLINEYSNLILAIENDENEDPLWHRFYQIQMAIYILNNQRRKLQMEEALEAYQRINRTWDDLNLYLKAPCFQVKNLDNLFKSIHIDLPNDCRYLMIVETK